MSFVQTALLFGAIPLGIIAVLFIAVYGRSLVSQPNRYRPGKPWDFAPSWYVPHPDAVVHSVSPGTDGRDGSSTTAVGGASGEW